MATHDSRKDINYAFGWTRTCLRIFGVFPDPDKSLEELRKPKIRFILFSGTLIYFVIIPEIVNLFRCWGQLDPVIQRFTTINFVSTAVCKIIITFHHRKALRNMLISVYADWTNPKSPEDRERMLQIVKRTKEFFPIIGTVYVLGLGSYSSLHLRNFAQNWNNPERYLLYRPVISYGTQQTPIYEVTFFGQFGGDLLSVLMYSCVDNFVSSLLLHICGQLINLRHALDDLVSETMKNPGKFNEGLGEIIRRHEFLIGFARKIDSCYSWTLLAQVAGTTLQLCVLAFQFCNVILDSAFKSSYIRLFWLFIYVCLVMVQFFIYCYAGDKLQDESMALGYGGYSCKWYDLAPRNAKNFMMIAYRSKTPLQLSLGKFGIFSLELFGAILRASMGYLSVLLTVKEQNS